MTWFATPLGEYPGPVELGASTGSAPPAGLLQHALTALGATNGDPALMHLTVDCVIGPATAKAMNHALATYIGATGPFTKPDLTAARVRQYAGQLAAIVVARVKKSGGTVPPFGGCKKPAPRVSAPIPVFSPTQSSMQPSGFALDKKWIWIGVGGVSLLVLMSLAKKGAAAGRAAADRGRQMADRGRQMMKRAAERAAAAL